MKKNFSTAWILAIYVFLLSSCTTSFTASPATFTLNGIEVELKTATMQRSYKDHRGRSIVPGSSENAFLVIECEIISLVSYVYDPENPDRIFEMFGTSRISVVNDNGQAGELVSTRFETNASQFIESLTLIFVVPRQSRSFQLTLPGDQVIELR